MTKHTLKQVAYQEISASVVLHYWMTNKGILSLQNLLVLITKVPVVTNFPFYIFADIIYNGTDNSCTVAIFISCGKSVHLLQSVVK